MAHHNFDSDSYVIRELLETKRGEERLGATGDYPDGHYGNRDEGEIRFAVAADPGRGVVLVDFGKPVHSLGMLPDEAVALAEMLRKKAWEARGIEST